MCMVAGPALYHVYFLWIESVCFTKMANIQAEITGQIISMKNGIGDISHFMTRQLYACIEDRRDRSSLVKTAGVQDMDVLSVSVMQTVTDMLKSF